jgi:hypothetical protein
VLILDAPVAARDRPRTQRARVLTSDAADGPVDDGEAHPGQFTAGEEVTGLDGCEVAAGQRGRPAKVAVGSTSRGPCGPVWARCARLSDVRVPMRAKPLPRC